MDERYDMVRTVTDGRFRYIRNYAPHRPWAQHEAYEWQAAGYQAWERARLAGTLNAAQSRFWGEKPAEEFYDLAADRDQIDNLIGAANHQGRIRAMRRALDAHLVATHDAGFIPEGSPLEGYAESRAPGAYPLRRVMALAELAIRRDPAQLAVFQTGLDDANEAMRFWAAQGLLMLGARSAPARARLKRTLTLDPSAQVRIVAAEALAWVDVPDEPVAALAGLCAGHSDPRVRLQALNALTFIGEAARPALPAIQACAASTDEYLRNAGRYLTLTLTGRYRPEAKVYGSAPL
jgi:HEAT repeat protein